MQFMQNFYRSWMPSMLTIHNQIPLPHSYMEYGYPVGLERC